MKRLPCCLRQAEAVHELNEEIGKLLAKAEQLGADASVEEAQKVLQEVEKVRTRKKIAEVSISEPFLYSVDEASL